MRLAAGRMGSKTACSLFCNCDMCSIMKSMRRVFLMCLLIPMDYQLAMGESKLAGELSGSKDENTDSRSSDGTELTGILEQRQAIALSTKAACIAACNRGREAMEQFCRGIPDPRLKPGCWAAAVASTVACINWCAWNY